MRTERLPRASWDELLSVAKAQGLSLQEQAAPGRRLLHLSTDSGATVALSPDLRWYDLSCTLSDGATPPDAALRLAGAPLRISRPACDGQSHNLFLLSEAPAGSAAALAAALRLYAQDVQPARDALLAEAETSGGGLTAGPPPEGIEREVEAFLQHAESHWEIVNRDTGVWRLVRRPTSRPDWPTSCVLAIDADTAVVSSVVHLHGEASAEAKTARALFLLRLNAGRLAGGRILSDGNVEWRAAMPATHLHVGQLKAGLKALLEAHSTSALELQALSRAALAGLYLRLQGINSLK